MVSSCVCMPCTRREGGALARLHARRASTVKTWPQLVSMHAVHAPCFCNTPTFEIISATWRYMKGVMGRGRAPQKCGILDTVRGMQPSANTSCWDTCRRIHTAQVVQGGRRCADTCLYESSVVLTGKNDRVLPPFDHRSLQKTHRQLPQSSRSFAQRYVDFINSYSAVFLF